MGATFNEEEFLEDMFDMAVQDGDEHEIQSYADHVIFLVHITSRMFEEGTGNIIPISTILSSLSKFMKSKIISSNKDKIGLVFFGCQYTNNTGNFKGVDALIDLDFYSADGINKVEQLKKRFSEFKQLDNNYEYKLYEALWACSSMFKESKGTGEVTQRLFMFTSDDDPNSNDKKEQETAINHMKSMNSSDIEIELFPIDIPSFPPFQMNRFYGNAIVIDKEDVSESTINFSVKLAQLNSRIRKKEFSKRLVSRIDFKFGGSVSVGVRAYSLISKQSKPTPIHLHRETNELLSSNYVYSCVDSNTSLGEHQIGYITLVII